MALELASVATRILILNLSIEFAGLFLCIFGILNLRLNASLSGRAKRYFTLFLVVVLLFTLSNMLGQLFRGSTGPFFRAMLFAFNFLEFAFSCTVFYVASMFLLETISDHRTDIGKKQAFSTFLTSMLILHMTLLVVSQFTGIIYTINAANIYQRSPLYFLAYIGPLAMAVLDVVLLIRNTSYLSLKELTAFWFMLLIPVAAMVIQIFVYGIYLVVIATVLATLIMISYIISDLSDRMTRQARELEILNDELLKQTGELERMSTELSKQTRELEKLKADILQFQIQPHFIYNTLNTAYLLSSKDPSQAAKLIKQFTTYLKGSITAMSQTALIPYSEEIEHTKSYAAIIKTRYKDAFDVEFDTPELVFELPPLSVQPLVENALKHGVLKSDKDHNIISIKAREIEDAFEISVTDDGPGIPYDPERESADMSAQGDSDILSKPQSGSSILPKSQGDGTHVGLYNIKERLRLNCDGQLLISSEPGKGTTVTIRIPKFC